MSDREVVVLSGVRTAVGTYGGTLKDQPLVDAAAKVVKEAVQRAKVEPAEVGQVVFGNVIHSDPRDMYLARYAGIRGGLPIETPAFTLNRLCGSGLQAIVSAAQWIMLGDADTTLAGGAESMSRVPYWLPGLRWGQRMNDGVAVDALIGGLQDPFDSCHMGITGENVAKRWKISREDQDALALESHKRAAKAIDAGRFKEQIMPLEIKQRKKTLNFDTDEHVRSDLSLEDLNRLKPVFDPEGTVTAGNSSGINDGTAAVVLMERGLAESRNLRPMARLVSYAVAGVEPAVMGIGPVPAIRECLGKCGLKVEDMDVIELNEAFAAQALAVIREYDLPMEKTNPNGSGISLGHPVGATGCIITIKALYELQRTGGRFALISMCIGGGQGIAAVFERLD